MLQTMKKKTKGAFAIIASVLLISSFALWGVADYVQAPGHNQVAATVGDYEISLISLANVYRNDLRSSGLASLDSTAQRDLGLASNSLDRLINQAALAMEARTWNLRPDERLIADAIRADERFQDAGGFSRSRFEQYLRSVGSGEASFAAGLADQIGSEIVSTAFVPDLPPLPGLSRVAVNYLAERRDIILTTLTETAADQPGPIEESEIARFFEENAEDFRRPESRSLSFLWVDPDQLASAENINAQDVRAVYDAARDRFTTPETRRIRQIRFSTGDQGQATAQAAKTALDSGQTIDELTAEGAINPANISDLGDLSVNDFPTPELAQAAFDLPAPGLTTPIEGPFGWILFDIMEITPQSVAAFSDVSDQLEQELREERALDILPDRLRDLDDGLGRGDSLETIGRIIGLPVLSVEIGRDGRSLDGSALSLPSGSFLSDAFALTQGETSFLSETDDGGGYAIRIDVISESHIPEMTAIKEELTAALRSQKVMEKLEQRAKALSDQVNAGAALQSLGEGSNSRLYNRLDRQGQPQSSESLNELGSLNELQGDLSDSLANALNDPPENNTLSADLTEIFFDLELGKATYIPQPALAAQEAGQEALQQFLVGQVTAIYPPDGNGPDSDENYRSTVETALSRNVKNSLGALYTRALRDRHAVSQDQDVINQVYGQ